MSLASFSITAVWKFRILPRSGYFGALGGLTCSKVFAQIPLAISAVSTWNLTSSLSQSLNAVTDFSLTRSVVDPDLELRGEGGGGGEGGRSYLPCWPLSLQSFLLFLPKIRGPLALGPLP